MRPNGWRPTTAYGSAASFGGVVDDGAHAKAFLGDVEARPDSPEAGVAHRAIGITRWFAGEYRDARDHLERALVLFQPGRDDDLAFRFGRDPGVAAMDYLALTLWPIGDVRRAVSLVRRRADADRGPVAYRHPRERENARGVVRIDARRASRMPH